MGVLLSSGGPARFGGFLCFFLLAPLAGLFLLSPFSFRSETFCAPLSSAACVPGARSARLCSLGGGGTLVRALGRARAGMTGFRGAIVPEAGRAQDVARKVKVELEAQGLVNEPVGLDICEPPILFALQDAGLRVVDGQQLLQRARMIKTEDEITL